MESVQVIPLNESEMKNNRKKESKPTVKRTLTSKSLRKFSERELKDGLKYLIEMKQVPQRLELGNINKLSKEALIKYCKPWAMANYYQAVLQQREVREKNAPVITEKQKRIIRKLNRYSVKNILVCIKNLKVDIKNTYSMKKEELSQAVALSDRAMDTLYSVRELEDKQEQDKENLKIEKQKQKEESDQFSSSEEESPKKITKKHKRLYFSEDESSESEEKSKKKRKNHH